MSLLGIVLVVIVVLVLFGGLTGGVGPYAWGNGYGGGHFANGGFGLVLIILVVLLLMGRL